MIDCREPMPAREPRDYTGHATHVLVCDWCGFREAFVEKEPFGWVRATSAARKRGWIGLTVEAGRLHRFVCSDVCAAHHPHHGRPA